MQQATVPLTPEQILEQLRALSTAERLRAAEQIVREAAEEAFLDAAAATMRIWSDESDDDFGAFQTALKQLRVADVWRTGEEPGPR